jgi:hypothetical protein
MREATIEQSYCSRLTFSKEDEKLGLYQYWSNLVVGVIEFHVGI